MPGSTSTVCSPRNSAIRDSAKIAPSSVRVPGPASITPGASSCPSTISASDRGPGLGSIGSRSQVTPPIVASVPSCRQSSAAAERADDVAPAADAQHQRAGAGPHGVVESPVSPVQAAAQATGTAGASTLASRTTASMPAAARSNSSSAITGVPSNGRSRSISTQDLQPSYSGLTRTVTGRWIL